MISDRIDELDERLTKQLIKYETDPTNSREQYIRKLTKQKKWKGKGKLINSVL